jgi:hypothetical protein
VAGKRDGRKEKGRERDICRVFYLGTRRKMGGKGKGSRKEGAGKKFITFDEYQQKTLGKHEI